MQDLLIGGTFVAILLVPAVFASYHFRKTSNSYQFRKNDK